MISRDRTFKSIVVFTCLAICTLTFSLQPVSSQEKPLTLAAILVGLQSTSSGMTLSQKNSYVTERVKRLGVSFKLTSEIENELRLTGASMSLRNAIRENGPQTAATPVPAANKPIATFEKIWVDYDVTEKQRKGMRVHLKFRVSKMKGTDGFLALYFEKQDGDLLTSKNKKYSSKSGQLAVYRNIKPNFDPAVFKDLSVFMPYGEIGLVPGDYNLKLDADIIYKSGTMISHLATHEFTFKKPKPAATSGQALFDKMWVDYDVSRNGLKGMVIHTKMTIKNLKGTSLLQAVYFEKQSGVKLYTSNTKYRDTAGQVAVFRNLKPGFDSTVYKDLQVFIPYKEFNLRNGVHNLKMHSDVIRPSGDVISHLTFHKFRYTKK